MPQVRRGVPRVAPGASDRRVHGSDGAEPRTALKMSWAWRRRKPIRTILIDEQGNRVEPEKQSRARFTSHRRTDCLGGCGKIRKHGSMEEARYCNQLALEVKAGKIKSYASQVRFPIRDPRNTYTGKFWTPDFVVTLPNGREVIHEYKGFATEEYRLRRMLFHWNYPNLETIEKKARDLYL